MRAHTRTHTHTHTHPEMKNQVSSVQDCIKIICLILDINRKRNPSIYEYYLAIRKEIMPFVTTWLDLEGIMLSEVSQKEKDKYCMILFVSGI